MLFLSLVVFENNKNCWDKEVEVMVKREDSVSFWRDGEAHLILAGVFIVLVWLFCSFALLFQTERKHKEWKYQQRESCVQKCNAL